jgi:hypothetical protein
VPGNEAVAIQLEIKLRKPKNVEPTRDLLDAVVRHWANTGVAPRGMKIRIIDWKHSGKSRHKAVDQRDARLRFRGLLQSGRFTISLRSN